jgi:hypothetical protein
MINPMRKGCEIPVVSSSVVAVCKDAAAAAAAATTTTTTTVSIISSLQLLALKTKCINSDTSV